MTYLKTQLAAHKETTDKQKQIEAEKNKKAQNKAEIQAAKNEVKRDRIVQKDLTKIFNKLNNDLDITLNALKNNNGVIKKSVGGVNSLSEFFTRGFGLGIKNITSLTEEDLNKNDAYQQYKSTLEQEGFALEISDINPTPKDMTFFRNWFLSCNGATAGLIGIGVLANSGIGFLGIFSSFIGTLPMACIDGLDAANITLKIKEKTDDQGLEAPEQDNNILEELNTKGITQPQAMNVIR